MKIMLRAAIAALSIASIGPVLADGGEGTVANTQFTELPGVVAQAQVPNVNVCAERPAEPAGAEPAGTERPSCARIWRLQHPVGPRRWRVGDFLPSPVIIVGRVRRCGEVDSAKDEAGAAGSSRAPGGSSSLRSDDQPAGPRHRDFDKVAVRGGLRVPGRPSAGWGPGRMTAIDPKRTYGRHHRTVCTGGQVVERLKFPRSRPRRLTSGGERSTAASGAC
jgi:hypothetical protein